MTSLVVVLISNLSSLIYLNTHIRMIYEKNKVKKVVREKDLKQYRLVSARGFLILFIVWFCFFVAAKAAYAQATFLSASEQVLISELISGNESLLADGRQGSWLISPAQSITATINFGPLEFNPPTGNQDEEYITLVNPHDFVLDISSWRIDNDIEYIFQPGVLIPAGGTLFISPDVAAFTNRTISPKGGEGHLIQGNYKGNLSNSAGVITLYNAEGMLVNSTTFGAVSPMAGQLIISELNYNPSPYLEAHRNDSSEIDGDELEFIELINIGDNPLDLSGVNFRDGISYTFPEGTSTIEPGQLFVLVRNQAEFRKRYPDVSVRYIYEQKLANGGETITLVDKEGAIISSFEYNDKFPWPQTPDGDGYTLVRRHPFADPNDPTAWEVSSDLYGSPSFYEYNNNNNLLIIIGAVTALLVLLAVSAIWYRSRKKGSSATGKATD